MGWRRREDSNPWCLAAQRFSRPPRSAALPRLRWESPAESLGRSEWSVQQAALSADSLDSPMTHPVLAFDDRFTEALLRLMPALLMGGLIGLNRDLRGKPVGFRTLGLVGMGSALMTYLGVSLAGTNDGSASRVFHGIITGIGFLGPGVILQPAAQERVREVRGLTTAACVWVVACISAAR